MTLLLAMLNDRSGKVHKMATLWSIVLTGICAAALWYHASIIQAHQTELNKIINYAPEGVVVCSEDGQVLYTNDAVRVITGYTEPDLVRGGVELIIPPELRTAHRDGMENARTKAAHGIEGVNYKKIYPVRRKDGSYVVCLVSVGSINKWGGPQFFAFIVPLVENGPNSPTNALPSNLNGSTAEIK